MGGFGGTTRLARLVGRTHAAKLLLRGRAVDAETALSIGLVHAVVDSERVVEEVMAWLADILPNSPLAVQLTWKALHRGLDMPLDAAAQLGADLVRAMSGITETGPA